LTAAFATFWTARACWALVSAIRRVKQPGFLAKHSHLPLSRSVNYAAWGAGWFVGVGTLFRPETPLVLIVAAVVLGVLFLRLGSWRRWFCVSLPMTRCCVMAL